jgi:hypothetical protein
MAATLTMPFTALASMVESIPVMPRAESTRPMTATIEVTSPEFIDAMKW